ncbi:HNH endonuclease [Sutcliffiella halmapala]
MEKNNEKSIVNSYMTVICPDHPKAMQGRWVYEHTLVAEVMLGRPLREDEQVHHLDFNRLNNKKSNLLVLTKGQHTKLHNWIDRMRLQSVIEAQATEGYQVEQCQCCGEYIKDYGNEKFCNSDCQKRYYDENMNIPVSKEEFIEMLEQMNKVEMAKVLNTHRSNIDVWERQFGLNKGVEIA